MQKIYNFYLAYYTCINAIIILTYIILWRIVLIPNIVLAEEQANNNKNTLAEWLGAAGMLLVLGIGFYYAIDSKIVTEVMALTSATTTVSICDAVVSVPLSTSAISIGFVSRAILQISSFINADNLSLAQNPRTRMTICHGALFHNKEWFDTNIKDCIILNENKKKVIDDIIQTCGCIVNHRVLLPKSTKQIALNIGLLMTIFKEERESRAVEHYFITEELEEWSDRYIKAINKFITINKNLRFFDCEYVRSITGQDTFI